MAINAKLRKNQHRQTLKEIIGNHLQSLNTSEIHVESAIIFATSLNITDKH